MLDKDRGVTQKEQIARLTAIKTHLTQLRKNATGEALQSIDEAINHNERLIKQAQLNRNIRYMTKGMNKPIAIEKVIDPNRKKSAAPILDTNPTNTRLAIYSANGLVKDKKYLTLVEIAHHLGSHADAVQLQKYANEGLLGKPAHIKGSIKYPAEAVNQIILNGMSSSQKKGFNNGSVKLIADSNNGAVKLI